MPDKEIALLKTLVRAGFDMTFTRGCDDFDDDLLKDFTLTEIAQLSVEFSDWNGDPEEMTDSRFTTVGMRSAGAFLFSKAMKELEAR